jgi:hypothetical protein
MDFIDNNDLFGRMSILTNNPIFKGLRDADADLTDALSWGQLKSKRWLIDELEECGLDLGTVFVCGGWYGTLSAMMLESNLKIKKIRSFDIDPHCADVADTVNKPHVMNEWKFKAVTEDMHDINYTTHRWRAWSNSKQEYSKYISDSPDTIINTSCEHIHNFKEWYDKIPEGKLLVLQSNDYFEVEEHVNCSETLDDFWDQTPMRFVEYSGELELPKYTRFMRIGYK